MNEKTSTITLFTNQNICSILCLKEGVFMDKRRKVDVICQHSSDGNIMPLKIRFEDEDGQWQTYIIKEYKDISHQGTRTLPDGMFITDNTIAFE